MAQGQISEPKAALSFILGGKSFTTLVSLKSGNRYTYKIELADKRNPTNSDTWFVSLLMGPDNWSNYKYIGMIKNNQFRWTGKSKVSQDAPSLLGFQFVFESLQADTMCGFEVWHMGKCGRCGKPLTVPESIASGFGPDCREMMGIAAAPVTAAGAVAPQHNLNFDGSIRQPKAHGVAANAVMNDSPRSDKKFLAAFAAPNVGELDAMIRARIVTYKSEAPENYYQDGELDEKQAFNVAYNKFRVQIESGK
jgi:hypothetical protein